MPEKLTVGSLFSGIPSEDSTVASSEPVCALCGSASRTRSASGSSLGTGPESRVIPTCAPLWPTPTASDFKQQRFSDTVRTGSITAAMNRWQRGMECPCRCHTSTSSAAGSPAKTSASPAAGPDWPENARVFGGSSQGSLATYDPATSSWKTSQLSLLEDSTSSLGTLPRAGSMRNGTIFRRRPLAPLTGATGSGLWLTPRAGATSDQTSERGHFLSLDAQVRRPDMWPTPTRSEGMGGAGRSATTQSSGFNLRTAAAMAPEGPPPTPTRNYPTPNARDWKEGNMPRPHGQHSDSLPVVIAKEMGWGGGSLNPTWVEWLMGFPAGWTEVE